MLVSLRYHDYRRLWLASLFAGGAAWALIVARGWLVYTISGSSMWVGLVTFAAMAPMFLTPLIAGYLADKFNRKKMLASLFVVQLGHNIVLAILAFQGSLEIPHIVLLSFVNGCARASQVPATQAMLPNLIPKEHLLNAISLNVATLQGSRLIGPALIAPLMATVGPEYAFALCTLMYLFSFLITLSIKTVSVGQIDTNQSATQNFFAGLTFVYRHPLILPLVLTTLFHCCLTMSFESLLPSVSEKLFTNGGAGATYLMMAVGAGALCLVLITANIKGMATRGRFLLLAGLISGLSPIFLGLSSNQYMALASCALMGGAQASYMAIAGAVVQEAAPAAIRGRVMSVFIWHMGSTMAAFNLINATIADTVGFGLVLGISGLVFVFIMLFSVKNKFLRNLYIHGTLYQNDNDRKNTVIAETVSK